MSTNSKLRSQNLAKYAYLLRSDGNRSQEQVRTMVLLGERLKSIEPKGYENAS